MSGSPCLLAFALCTAFFCLAQSAFLSQAHQPGPILHQAFSRCCLLCLHLSLGSYLFRVLPSLWLLT